MSRPAKSRSRLLLVIKHSWGRTEFWGKAQTGVVALDIKSVTAIGQKVIGTDGATAQIMDLSTGLVALAAEAAENLRLAEAKEKQE